MLAPSLCALSLFAALPVASDPAVLLDPAAAAQAAREMSDSPVRTRAEILLMTKDPQGARALLPADPTHARDLRLLADAWVDELRVAEATETLDGLAAHSGWGKHARHQRAHLDHLIWQRHGARAGLVMFAMCLAVLALGGARELLRPHPESLVLLGLGLGSVALAEGAGPAVGVLTALLAACVLVLGHSAVATLRRTRPGARARLLLAVLVLLGVLGATGALGLQLGPSGILRGLAAGATPSGQGGTSG